MRADIAPGPTFPDDELSDHTGKHRKLCELQGQHPARGCIFASEKRARWANTRVSERLGIKYAKEQVMAGLLRVALKTIPTYVNHILLPAVIDDTFAPEVTCHVLPEDDVARSGCPAHVENKAASPSASEGNNQGRSNPHASSHCPLVPILRLYV